MSNETIDLNNVERNTLGTINYFDKLGEMIYQVGGGGTKVYKTLEDRIKDCYLEPAPGQVIVLPDAFEYHGTLVIPETSKRPGTTGVIVKIGLVTQVSNEEDPDNPGFSLRKVVNPCPWPVGTRIVYGQFSGTLIVIEGQPAYRIMQPQELLAQVTNPDAKILNVEV